jgi:hypothetical protein
MIKSLDYFLISRKPWIDFGPVEDLGGPVPLFAESEERSKPNPPEATEFVAGVNFK